ncbi:MAG: PEP-CTERM sorting domain-containing protein [bacterium]|nr:PEP-CTERM sorting domain-containing protein [bacterium]
MIALRVTLDERQPTVLENYSGLSPDPEPSDVPEPATLGLLGLVVVELIAVRMRRKRPRVKTPVYDEMSRWGRIRPFVPTGHLIPAWGFNPMNPGLPRLRRKTPTD